MMLTSATSGSSMPREHVGGFLLAAGMMEKAELAADRKQCGARVVVRTHVMGEKRGEWPPKFKAECLWDRVPDVGAAL